MRRSGGSKCHRVRTPDQEEWRAKLRHGFSLLFYGVGSKRRLLEEFVGELRDGPVVSLKGHSPDLQVGQLLLPLAHLQSRTDRKKQERPAYISVDSLSQGSRTTQKERKKLLDLIVKARFAPPVYLLIHGIDSPTLRGTEWRRTLQQVASNCSIKLLASADNILSPALFSSESWSQQFNFWPHHLTSMEPFSAEEKATIPQIQSQETWAASSSQSAEVVLRSLTRNGREVFGVVCELQLEQINNQEKLQENETRPGSTFCQKPSSSAVELGLTMQELYRHCRTQFLITNETALQCHLREFKDHGLLRSKRRADGTEGLFIPLPVATLENLQEKMNTWDE